MSAPSNRFTPGPWAVVAMGFFAGADSPAVFIGQRDRPERGMNGISDEYTTATLALITDESLYNASLIATAPELLGELDELVRLVEARAAKTLMGRALMDRVQVGKALVAKARTKAPSPPQAALDAARRAASRGRKSPD